MRQDLKLARRLRAAQGHVEASGWRRWVEMIKRQKLMVFCGGLFVLMALHAVVYPERQWFSASQDITKATSVILDGHTTLARELPRVYPNGVTNRFACDLPSLRYQCDLDAEEGCRAYPQLFPAGELMENWSPEDPTPPPQTFSSVCRFNVSSPYEFALAQMFHQMEVPFIAYGIPELDEASVKWTDEYLSSRLGEDEQYKVHIANSTHFMFYTRHMADQNDTATYESERWTYREFVQRMSTHRPGSQFFYFMVKAEDIRRRAKFATQDLMFLNADNEEEHRLALPSEKKTLAGPYGDLFIRDTQHAQSKGMRCRIGMRGIITEGHIDAGLNMIAMIRGHKRYILSPTSVCSCLGLLTKGPSARHTSIDWSNVTREDTKAFNCPATEVIVGAGDVLYVPSYWYHHIVSLDNTIQCNLRSGIIARPDVKAFLTACGLGGFKW
ncbi:hypothetical protein Poli38472_000083 [Pythium oligandrum]|uniref:JmjC domain-containing protein n=1 Tax=Pythium oligandrum TaxID=41045 RepID=A0A8K1CBR8_PYTOL|nr:hypothetical protein Poli38472_000083 [Pythium oligandrum]|eukprot:TMW60041.1 hypothetical protein Poli38472_000083 [Pythium oligandrum]